MGLSRRSFLALSSAGALSACGGGIPDLRGIPDVSNAGGISNSDPEWGAQIVEPQVAETQNDYAAVSASQIKVRRMRYYGGEDPRTLIVNPIAHKLYLIEDDGWATEYPIGIGRQGVNADYSNLYVARKATNPTWTLPVQVAGGTSNNPLGSHAIYFYDANTRSDTLLRAHGTMNSARHTVGGDESSGCFRMLNEHAAHLHGRVHIYGDDTDPTNKARVRYSPHSQYTPGMDYQSAQILNPYNITSGPKLAGVTP
jgi:lipoprotein-anchoring transpeptidase ErfK/SrfK